MNEIDAIITEDSDLIAHGNNNVIYKFENNGDCSLISFSDINQIVEFNAMNVSENKDAFLIYCILCVSFYLN